LILGLWLIDFREMPQTPDVVVHSPPSVEEELLLEQLMEAMPGFVFLVDDRVRVLKHNLAAGNLLGVRQQATLRKRGGDMLHCIHAVSAGGGCGTGDFCRHCLIRSAVAQALAGARCVRNRFRMELQTENTTRELYVLLSASALTFAGNRAVLLILEDVADLMQLHNLLPICTRCKRVRDAQQSWSDISAYLRRHMDLQVAKSYCPECEAHEVELTGLRLRFAGLTAREQQVFRLVAQGLLNKQVAAELGTAEKTIKIHRSRVMAKMQARSVVDLVNFADRLKTPPENLPIKAGAPAPQDQSKLRSKPGTKAILPTVTNRLFIK
jgi:DNA-binding CsgD family transcriptional regulator/PAS domain-containing protein